MSSKPIGSILLVEDNPGDARLIQEMVNDQGLNISALTHVTEMAAAEKMLAEYDFDIVLLDLGLPDAQGLEAVRRTHAAAPHVPLVVLTGFDDESLAAQALQEGAQDYLVKGEIETRGLLRALRYAVERKITDETARALTQAKHDFLASMSHELRTPLNAIIGFSGLMMDSRAVRPAPIRRYARLIQEASSTLLSIVNDVLDVSKIEAGGLDLDPRSFAPAQLIARVAELVRAQAEEKGLALEIVIDPALPPGLLGDETRLCQILLNLLSNAVKFTALGFVRLTTTLEPNDDPKVARVRFGVLDSGIGIPRGKRHRLFKRFSQVDSSTSRRFGGTGLGLSICKSLVEIMGGTIEVQSEEGWGSDFSFVIDLPLSDSVVIAETPPALRPPPTGRKLRILLAEDVPMNQELAVALLTKWGYEVDVAVDGAAAFDAVRRTRYDLVLMDIQMPVMDGVEATMRIRALGGDYATMPILAVTACVLTNDVTHFLASGLTAHVCKPFVARELLAAIELHTQSTGPSQSPQAVGGEDAKGAVSTTLDRDMFEGLWEALGAERMRSLLAKFQIQLDASFPKAKGGKIDLLPLRHEAHALVGTAGALGFRSLSEACRSLEEACGDMDPDAVPTDLLVRARRMKALAQRELRKEVADRYREAA